MEVCPTLFSVTSSLADMHWIAASAAFVKNNFTENPFFTISSPLIYLPACYPEQFSALASPFSSSAQSKSQHMKYQGHLYLSLLVPNNGNVLSFSLYKSKHIITPCSLQKYEAVTPRIQSSNGAQNLFKKSFLYLHLITCLKFISRHCIFNQHEMNLPPWGQDGPLGNQVLSHIELQKVITSFFNCTWKQNENE